MKKIPVRQIKDSFVPDRFSIRRIESLTTETALNHERHRHDFYFILLVEKGSGAHEIDFVTHPVIDQSIFVVRPGQVHQLTLSKGSSGFMLQFNIDFYAARSGNIDNPLRKLSSIKPGNLSYSSFEKIGMILNIIFQEYTQKEYRYKEAVMASLDILFIELFRQDLSQPITIPEAKLYALERLETLQNLLENHIQSKKQVHEYAAMLNITPYQLNAITKTLLQKTGSELINDQIILEAKRLLIGTSSQVNQIADHLGYQDPSYFIRFFKKHTGQTPESFRQNLK